METNISALARRHKGFFIVLEGADGSGKTTQFNLLKERLENENYVVEVFDFPRYEEPSSHFVRKYLNGEYGPAASIDPYTASIFYALDRFEAAPKIYEALAEGKVVLSNRYVGSNMAHQGAKFKDESLQRGFFLWEDGLEYHLLKIPRPNINLYLRVPAEVSYELVAKKATREYTNKKRDEHEADIDHLKKSVATYDTLCQLFPKDFLAIECHQNGELLSIDAISRKIWKTVKPRLPSVLQKADFRPPPKASPPPLILPVEKELPADAPKADISIKLPSISLLALSIINLPDTKYSLPAAGSFGYYVPENLPKDLANLYRGTLEKIKSNQKDLRKSLLDYASRHNLYSTKDVNEVMSLLLPLATLVSAEIKGTAEAMHDCATKLRGHRLPEVRQAAELIDKQVAKSVYRPIKDSKASAGNPPELLKETISKIKEHQMHIPELDEIHIINYQPRNEFDVLPEALGNQAYEKKRQALIAAIKSGAALEKVSYRAISNLDRISLNQLVDEKIISDVGLQHSSPKYGYRLPEIVISAGAEVIYEELFEMSSGLFNRLQQDGKEKYSVYTTLLGHKLPVTFTASANSLKSAQTSNKHIYQFLTKLKDAIAEVHPNIAENLDISLIKQKASPKKARSRTTRRRSKKT